MKADKIQEINNSQRLCLSHILRNCEQSLEGVTAVVENERIKLSASDINAALIKVREKINNIIEATSKNEFCSLSPEECKFVCDHTKCKKRDAGYDRHRS